MGQTPVYWGNDGNKYPIGRSRDGLSCLRPSGTPVRPIDLDKWRGPFGPAFGSFVFQIRCRMRTIGQERKFVGTRQPTLKGPLQLETCRMLNSLNSAKADREPAPSTGQQCAGHLLFSHRSISTSPCHFRLRPYPTQLGSFPDSDQFGLRVMKRGGPLQSVIL